ncbi:hypothetical protein G7054_g14075 [Neopestalotiopsis clavispora]|nr:hypothetical protein G7054_g14075 [Neopestalotiopsis clavispora]
MSGWKHAFNVSKEDLKKATPPGTIVVTPDDVSIGEVVEATGNLHRFPVPSADPADPLNWPNWRKHALLVVAAIYSFVANFASSSVAPALQLWPMFFPMDQRTFAELTRLVAVNVLMIGAANIWWVPLSNILGRRPVLLAAMLILVLTTLWCGLATSYNSLLAARVLQGIGSAAADTVAPALVGDVYFMDERGRAMAVYTIFLATGSIVGGLAGANIAANLGWAYIFWIVLALAAACLVATIFLIPETLYHRKTTTLTAADLTPQGSSKGVTLQEESAYPPYTYGKSLGFRKPSGGVVHHFIKPWRSLALPGTWVVTLQYGGLVGGIVTISTIGPQLVAMPPYLWGNNAGLINVGGLIGTIVGYIYTYIVSDARLKSSAKHHHYVEAEARLPTMFPALFIATAGFLVFGFCAQNPGPNVWVGLQFGYGMITFGLMQAPSIGFNYLIDAYSYLAADCFVIAAILRAVVGFAWSIFVADWIQKDGAAEPFGIFGMLMGIFSLLAVPLWLWGKRLRIATASTFSKERVYEQSHM